MVKPLKNITLQKPLDGLGVAIGIWYNSYIIQQLWELFKELNSIFIFHRKAFL